MTPSRHRVAGSGSRSWSWSHDISLAWRLLRVDRVWAGGRRACSQLLALVLVGKGFTAHRTAVAIGVWELGSEAVAKVCRFAVAEVQA